MPPRFGTKSEYKHAIAQAIGLDCAEDLAFEQEELIDALSFYKVEIILDLIESAATTVSADVVSNYEDGPAMLNDIYTLASSAIKSNKSASSVDLARKIIDVLQRNDEEDDEDEEEDEEEDDA